MMFTHPKHCSLPAIFPKIVIRKWRTYKVIKSEKMKTNRIKIIIIIKLDKIDRPSPVPQKSDHGKVQGHLTEAKRPADISPTKENRIPSATRNQFLVRFLPASAVRLLLSLPFKMFSRRSSSSSWLQINFRHCLTSWRSKCLRPVNVDSCECLRRAWEGLRLSCREGGFR